MLLSAPDSVLQLVLQDGMRLVATRVVMAELVVAAVRMADMVLATKVATRVAVAASLGPCVVNRS